MLLLIVQSRLVKVFNMVHYECVDATINAHQSLTVMSNLPARKDSNILGNILYYKQTINVYAKENW